MSPSHNLAPASSRVATQALCGVRAWPWYLRFWRDPIDCISTVYRRFGPLFVLAEPKWLGHPGRVHALAIGPRYNRMILGQPDKYHAGGFTARGRRDSALRRLRRGLAGTNGERHRRQRQLISPPLQRPAVESYLPEMAEIIDRCLDTWPLGEPVDVHRLMRELSLRLSSQLLFGNEDVARANLLSAALENFLVRAAAHGAAILPLNVPGLPYRRMLKVAEDLERQIEEMIALKRRTGSRGGDLLSIMVRASDQDGAAFAASELPGHTVLMFAASFETAAGTLAWTLFLLAQHPEVALHLLDELDGARLGNPPSLAELDALPFLEAVINESLRLVPPLPYTIRTATMPVDLDGAALNRGDRVFVSHYMTHRIPELYPEPLRFLPERWRTLKPDPYGYLPFSAGPRICVGYHFGNAELRLALIKILTRFRFSVVPGARIDRIVRVTVKPTFGLPMTVHPQDRKFRAAPVTGQIHGMVDLPAGTT